MTTTISLQISLDSLIQAVSSLDLEAKRHLLNIIEQQIFEAEEDSYIEDSETKAEIESVRLEYQQGDFVTIDDFIQTQSN
ncbi:MAG: hypothetical protein DCF17_03530 [Shackletoniella antarctica]|jgi:hypothetical protein|uniref:Uncharacterized protein n=1 Tax=Shackletoniella antarctica TaxID=268115 RepID=A0A2W4WIM2_9CYAN|nr:MAG: hypothetical protein DCF17_03530 [Shackletoniella antarctica]